MHRAVQEGPVARHGPNRVARDIVEKWLLAIQEKNYRGPESDRVAMQAELVKAALSMVGAPCKLFEPSEGTAPRASESRLARLVQGPTSGK